ncbi:MAG TPA: UDP-3-O-[3-hydroxymyristoyl] N-acetylglucosamine deacetylase [Saprospirales bacterium]|nr:UDP-3-O-[3-hydroxymyristoyl] N-acetylglucosamine deacetylase [Saprospirales bacterium]HAY70560.1 UDP-3-O-[3-hydroxymyristoyl] N-acetylglucosamine deacetylase [Saprospirales bacterium]HRQ30231.1 bifunctional UDP-3-O-[3-hydroxymyristoyl] N-acetylglucosamine deacetylase/3-hydroxyacyl-ACP dehydratase [Saprospiraceae bacterium]
MEHRKTIEKPFSLTGKGLHTGSVSTVTFQPAEVNFGVRFQRIDLEGQPEFQADLRYVSSTKRGTTLTFQEASVRTIEHTMSALFALGIDDILIQLDGPEMPILDGSSVQIVDALQSAGIVARENEKEVLEIEETIVFKYEETDSEYILMPAEGFAVQALINFNKSAVQEQFAELNKMEDYITEIAPARTFGFFSEIESLFQRGLALGGDLSNAIVVADRQIDQAELNEFAKKMGLEKLEVSREGILNNTPLRFRNELARHKVLDILGDLGLFGVRIKGKIIAKKPGHEPNLALAKMLLDLFRKQKKLKGKPKYDLAKPALLDINDIAALLPHRYPFLLVDKIIEMTDTYIVGIKNVTFNENYFTGHFPENPVMPGVLQIEAMAQVGGILALKLQEDPLGWDTYFLKIDKVKFKQKVLPGDSLVIKLEMMEPIRRGIVHMWGTIYCGDNVVSEGELMAQIVKR